MSEITFLFRSHPLVTGLLLLGLSPVCVLILVLFSPLLVTFMLFMLGIAGLARSRRRLGRHKSRRRRYKHRSAGDGFFWGDDLVTSGNEGLESEKQQRVNEYLEDQLKNLEDLRPLEAPFLGMDDAWAAPLDPSSSWDGLDDDDDDGFFPDNCGARSDVSDLGDENSGSLEAWQQQRIGGT
ncbi:hypothetical protein SELMODRAFT_438990 [Selaginella moellendorffii]|uniref:Uncharacterized protein n=1 Tax=Selaginella moellendorffii TaxID=88036 RepID=D8R1K2_SELML|nr:hypothetical protein SELMODRAFT_438990 [Selaginella moellendorffii]